jgi:hypothetical protein
MVWCQGEGARGSTTRRQLIPDFAVGAGSNPEAIGAGANPGVKCLPTGLGLTPAGVRPFQLIPEPDPSGAEKPNAV